MARELVRADEMEGLVEGHILIGINALHIDLVVLAWWKSLITSRVVPTALSAKN